MRNIRIFVIIFEITDFEIKYTHFQLSAIGRRTFLFFLFAFEHFK